MKGMESRVFLSAIVMAVAFLSGQAVALDLSTDNPATLIGTKSTDYTIYGFRLGQSHEEAWKIIEKNNLIGKKPLFNPSRIDVFTRNADGTKGKQILLLIWRPKEQAMSGITVFQDCRALLSENFQRLLNLEAVDDGSAFKRAFIGTADSSKVTLRMRRARVTHTTYYYDRIGLEVTFKHSPDGDEVVFEIVPPTR